MGPGYNRSLFERPEALGEQPSVLEEQYRMAPPILAWRNCAFYGNRIRAAAEDLQRSWEDWVEFQKLRRLNPRLRRRFGACRLFDSSGAKRPEEPCNQSWRNRSEALLLLMTLADFCWEQRAPPRAGRAVEAAAGVR